MMMNGLRFAVDYVGVDGHPEGSGWLIALDSDDDDVYAVI